MATAKIRKKSRAKKNKNKKIKQQTHTHTHTLKTKNCRKGLHDGSGSVEGLGGGAELNLLDFGSFMFSFLHPAPLATPPCTTTRAKNTVRPLV